MTAKTNSAQTDDLDPPTECVDCERSGGPGARCDCDGGTCEDCGRGFVGLHGARRCTPCQDRHEDNNAAAILASILGPGWACTSPGSGQWFEGTKDGASVRVEPKGGRR